METKKNTLQVIIAHPIPDERQRIAMLLEGSGTFSVCYMTHDGLDCLQAVVSLQPDLVLVHAVLDKIDGLELLRQMNHFPLPKTKRIYITNYSNYLATQAVLTGADYCILMPCSDEVLLQRVSSLVLSPQEVDSDERINAHTIRILRNLNAPEGKKGYHYAIDGVRILVRDPKLVMRRKVITELYGGIAKMHGLPNSQQAERCLRTLTQRIFIDNSPRVLERYFAPVHIQRSNITNTVFLSTIAQQVTAALQAEAKYNVTHHSGR